MAEWTPEQYEPLIGIREALCRIADALEKLTGEPERGLGILELFQNTIGAGLSCLQGIAAALDGIAKAQTVFPSSSVSPEASEAPRSATRPILDNVYPGTERWIYNTPRKLLAHIRSQENEMRPDSYIVCRLDELEDLLSRDPGTSQAPSEGTEGKGTKDNG